MITADEARVLAGPTANEILNPVWDQIEKAAKSKKFKITLRDNFWHREGYDGTDLYKECINILETAGYAVKYFFETNQFVDAGITISWQEM